MSKLDKPKPRRLTVRAYPDLHTWACPDVRSVYLMREDGSAASCDLWETDMPLTSAVELAAWAESVGIRVVCEPAGCLVSGFQWPKDGALGLVPPRKGGALKVFHDDGAFTEFG